MNILNSFKKNFFYRQHPETALRYGPIVDLLRDLELSESNILEVGSGSYGITPYLKKTVTGVDNNFEEPEYPLLKQVQAIGEKLPFMDNSFDVVLISDVLEHVPKENRKTVIEEAIRVGKKAVIVSGPFGAVASNQDKKLAEYSKSKIGKMHPYFAEHLKYGLPEVEEFKSYLNNISKVKNFEIVGEYFNLGIREILMKIYITNNKLQYYFYLKGLMFFVPVIKLFNQKPCYRTLILVRLKLAK